MVTFSTVITVISIFTHAQECGVLESVKSASDMFSPVAGQVTEKNEEVENGPALINQSPLTDGWLFK